MHNLQTLFPTWHPDLIANISETAMLKEFPKGVELLKDGQYVAVVPIVLEGLVKVFIRHDEKELLLYYIRPEESCVMSFTAGLNHAPSQVVAITEEPTKALLLPADHLAEWTRDFPDFNRLFFNQYRS